MLTKNLLKRAKEYIALVITPLLPKTISYVVAAFPKHQIKSKQIEQIIRCPRIAMNGIGFNLDSSWGDGESAMREYQESNMYRYLPESLMQLNDLTVNLVHHSQNQWNIVSRTPSMS